MAKLGELFGLGGNPWYEAFSDNRSTISGALQEFGTEHMLESARRGSQMDAVNLEKKQAEAERIKAINEAAAQKNATLAYLKQIGRDDLIAGIEGGMPIGEAWNMALTKPDVAAPSYDHIKEVNGVLVDLRTNQPVYSSPQTAEQPKPPTGYQYNPAQPGALMPIPGGPHDPASAPPRALSPTAQRELFEAEEAATAGQYVLSGLDKALQLNQQAYEGPFADLRGDAAALVGNQEGVATAELKNVTTELALTQLKTIFGSMPTEGERKILLELQGSVNQPRPVREAIYRRAKEMALRRIEDNKRKAAAIRSGQFFEEGFTGTPMSGSGGTTSTGVPWSIEP